MSVKMGDDLGCLSLEQEWGHTEKLTILTIYEEELLMGTEKASYRNLERKVFLRPLSKKEKIC